MSNMANPSSPRPAGWGDGFIILFALGAALISWSLLDTRQANRVLAFQNGSTVGRWEFSRHPDTVSLGKTMRIRISSDGVRVLSADCPRQLCVRHSQIRHPGQSIVCVPNRIVISLEKPETELDAVVR